MKNEKEVKVSYIAHHLTTIISVTLVLLLMGIIATIWISADRETRRLKEQIELSVILRDSVPQAAVKELTQTISASPYAQNVQLISKEEALRRWTAETGEDLQDLFGVNPLSEEIAFGIKSEYANAASIAKIRKDLEHNTIVESVGTPDAEMVEAMNSNLSSLTWILGIIAGVMLVISVVLINNTVHLSIYSRRFTIHTMQLVGATPGFIRRPIIIDNMLAGLAAGVLAAAITAVALWGARESVLPDMASYVSWVDYAIVAGSMIIAGMALCALASCIAANTYLRKDYDALFR